MIPEVQKIRWPKKLPSLLFAGIAIGVVSFVIGLATDSQRAWANFLLEYFFWITVAIGGVFFVALQHITGSSWSAPLRRIPEAFVAYLPAAALLFIVLCFGLHSIYEWTHEQVVAQDAILKLKVGYLNIPFFAFRNVGLLAIAGIAGFLMTRNSLRQDVSGDIALTQKNTTISAVFLLLFAWSFSFASFDLIMSLAPHWFSTIFGIYCFSILFLNALAMITIITILLKKSGVLGAFVNQNHLHDLGKLLFAFTVFWAYIAFSQFMLIWYANLPEETVYFLTRLTPDWKNVSIAMAFIKFVLPFFFLISRPVKRNENCLLFATIWIMGAQWLDVYWMVFPTFFDTPKFGFLEIGMFVGFLSIFALCVGKFLTRVLPVAIKDPLLLDGMHHHQ